MESIMIVHMNRGCLTLCFHVSRFKKLVTRSSAVSDCDVDSGLKKIHWEHFRFQVLTRDTEFVHLNKAETFLSFSSLRQRLLHVRAHLLEMILEFLILLPSFLQW